jgi:gliding motility-associated-like protein
MIANRLILILFLSIFAAQFAAAQNLFPNPGFEEYSQCPDKLSQSKRCKSWDGWAWNTPDYYNCGYYEQDFTGTAYATPYSGTGVMGFVNISNESSSGGQLGTYTEGIVCRLVQPLKAGHNYRLHFHFAIASQGVAADPNFGEELAFGFYFYNKNSRPEWNGTGKGTWKANSFTPQASVVTSMIDTFDRYQEFTFCITPTEDCDSAFLGGVSTPKTNELPSRAYYFNLDDISLVEQPDTALLASVSEDSICRNTCITLNTTDTNRISGLTWFAPGASFDTSKKLPLRLCYDEAGLFPLSITIMRNGSCAAFKWEDSILVKAPPQPYLPDTSLCPGQVLTVDFRSYADSRVLWSDGDTAHLKIFKTSGQYSVNFETSGCSSTQAFNLNVREYCAGEISVPTAFTPNGDGINDVFHVLSVYPLENFSIRIYNRWGQSVFYNTNAKAGWDGHKADVGTYFYMISYQHPVSKEIIKLKGDVALIR